MTSTTTVGDDELTFRVTSEESAGAITAFDVRMAPGGGPPVLHRHDPFELYRVEHGELAFYVEDEVGVVRRGVAGPGAVVAIPGGREHTVRNESAAEARAFVVFSPGAAMERFAREAAALTAVDDVLSLGEAHGIQMTRPLAELT